MKAAQGKLEAELGREFSHPELLVRALTHRSLANEQAADDLAHESGPAVAVVGDNERLEFLGDAVLGLVVAEALFLLHPEWHEGELTRVRAQLVSRQHMAEVAIDIGLGESSAFEPGRGAGRAAAQKHRTFEYHGSSDGGAVSRWRAGAGAGFCAPLGDG